MFTSFQTALLVIVAMGLALDQALFNGFVARGIQRIGVPNLIGMAALGWVLLNIAYELWTYEPIAGDEDEDPSGDGSLWRR